MFNSGISLRYLRTGTEWHSDRQRQLDARWHLGQPLPKYIDNLAGFCLIVSYLVNEGIDDITESHPKTAPRNRAEAF